MASKASKRVAAIQDPNDYPGMIAHTGTAGTAELERVTSTNGALDVKGGASVEAFGATVPQVVDVNAVRFLESIDRQLKIMNEHLSEITGDRRTEDDIPGGVI